MKEQMGRNLRRIRGSFLHMHAAVLTQNQKAVHASFVSRPRMSFTLLGIFAIIPAIFLILLPFYPARSAHAAGSVGFHISGRNLLDVNGNNFMMRGISHGYAWYLTQNSTFANIKATGANTVRVVLSGGNNGGGATSLANVQTAINQCKSNKLVCVLEDHDTTGYTGGSTGTLDQAVSYWKSLQSILTGQENWVIINIGNEAWGNSNTSGWISATKNAIVAMRNAGFQHTLMVDAPNWGQDYDHVMLNNASSVEATDPRHNTIFSVHMYGIYANASTVDSYLASFSNTGMPLVIGEFGANQPGVSSSDAADEIMADAQSRGIGYMGWSWSGNGSPVQYLDMVINFNPGQRSAWGSRIIAGANGIQQTSHECSCYGGSSGGGGGGGGSFNPNVYYKLIGHNSGQALDVAGASTANGARVDQWPDSGTANQQWRIIAVGGYYKLISRNSGQALDVAGASTANGALMDQWPDSGTANQQWSIIQV